MTCYNSRLRRRRGPYKSLPICMSIAVIHINCYQPWNLPTAGVKIYLCWLQKDSVGVDWNQSCSVFENLKFQVPICSDGVSFHVTLLPAFARLEQKRSKGFTDGDCSVFLIASWRKFQTSPNDVLNIFQSMSISATWVLQCKTNRSI